MKRSIISDKCLSESRENVINSLSDKLFITDNGIEIKWHLDNSDVLDNIEDIIIIDSIISVGIKNKSTKSVKSVVLFLVGFVLLISTF